MFLESIPAFSQQRSFSMKPGPAACVNWMAGMAMISGKQAGISTYDGDPGSRATLSHSAPSSIEKVLLLPAKINFPLTASRSPVHVAQA